jgi:integrase
MASRAIERMTALKVERARKRPGMYADGGGLYLEITPNGASWIFRYWVPERDPTTGEFVRDSTTHKVRGRSREMGLGPLRDVSLAEARVQARRYRNLRRAGIDPIEARNAERTRARLDAVKGVTFKECAEEYIETQRAGWTGKQALAWESTLATYAYPIIGSLPVRAIDNSLVLRVLEPIWQTRTETASRLRGRIEGVLDRAKVQGYRDGAENPARWRGHLDKLLPRRSKVQAVSHLPALPYAKLPHLMIDLRKQEDVAARALEFMILTAARSAEVLGAGWSEVNWTDKTWTIGAARMKARQEHRTPLSARALEILEEMKAHRADGDGDLMFPRPGHPHLKLHHGEPVKVLRRLGYGDITAHGFRSSFRDWAADRSNVQPDVAEAALAHKVGDKVRRAYQKGDMFERRRQLMSMWAEFCTMPPVERGEIIPLRAG